ncbi:MAG: class I SAM-dependent RNA methyltransferase [Bauldia sp.]|nr:class I SAM-dependent RNA methyltransferase [Bauldia sp.]
MVGRGRHPLPAQGRRRQRRVPPRRAEDELVTSLPRPPNRLNLLLAGRSKPAFSGFRVGGGGGDGPGPHPLPKPLRGLDLPARGRFHETDSPCAVSALIASLQAAETVTIAALGHEGDGIAETPAGRLYVPFTLPGETVSVERTSGERGHALTIVAPSPDRVAPPCRHFGTCGGCALQHMATGPYLDWKREQVRHAFAQRGIEAAVEPTFAAGAHARRRAVFTALGVPGGALLGFHVRASKELLDVEECPVVMPAIEGRLDALRRLAGIVFQPGQRGRITVLAADNGLDIAIERERRKPPDRPTLQKLAAFGEAGWIARISLDGEAVVQSLRPTLAAGGVDLYPSPGGFTQASAAAEEAMAAAVLAGVKPGAPVADLFAGIGTFTVRLARNVPVTAVEGDAAAVAALTDAARHATGLKAITATRRDLFQSPLAPFELKKFGTVVFDPPRAGASRQAESLAQSKVPRVVAVSCNPATLARDARILIDGGYRLTRVLPIDQFTWSAEIEAVATFER